jgi:hypothetical protein
MSHQLQSLAFIGAVSSIRPIRAPLTVWYSRLRCRSHSMPSIPRDWHRNTCSSQKRQSSEHKAASHVRRQHKYGGCVTWRTLPVHLTAAKHGGQRGNNTDTLQNVMHIARGRRRRLCHQSRGRRGFNHGSVQIV